MQGYMFLPLYYQDDLCDTILPGQAETFWAITFQGNKPKVNLADGSDLPIKESAVPENIVLCPKTFSANQNNYATLSDVYNAATEAMSKEGIDPSLQLSEILPESATLYHEIWHMVTYWDYISNGYNDVKNNGNEFVGDVTCE